MKTKKIKHFVKKYLSAFKGHLCKHLNIFSKMFNFLLSPIMKKLFLAFVYLFKKICWYSQTTWFFIVHSYKTRRGRPQWYHTLHWLAKLLFRKKNKLYIYIWHGTTDMWPRTYDIWQMTPDMWHLVDGEHYLKMSAR